MDYPYATAHPRVAFRFSCYFSRAAASVYPKQGMFPGQWCLSYSRRIRVLARRSPQPDLSRHWPSFCMSPLCGRSIWPYPLPGILGIGALQVKFCPHDFDAMLVEPPPRISRSVTSLIVLIMPSPECKMVSLPVVAPTILPSQPAAWADAPVVVAVLRPCGAPTVSISCPARPPEMYVRSFL